ncbi:MULTISPECIES: class I SAM-dependent methyltransferase [unclassified Pseudodesulfovibrio]|uniref:class I SAM-dependent methyltransferase n=1 Tax=unclassified Pseudodesulfovibrio TaxID=2661612 RepID=UPI000FEBBC61|nr:MULTISPECIES: class I SAM-dependent methyltransferase [unclassified Pseudodesulfovibrio]MCJ2163214.1 methyltransferase domain-containing protein [Pseudodesulfovibrio sp. S3-i]RWU07197.1 methyltransferase domain-containing protein [Pseudodesulfovibrio sp. S3]
MRNTKTLLRPCPVCGATHGTVLRAMRFAVFDDCPLTGEFEVILCDECSFVFYDTPNTLEDFTLFYEQHYFVSGYTAKGDVAVMRAKNSPFEVMGPRLRDDARICDIGCGKGDLLLSFKRQGYANLFGVDPSLDCVEYLNREHDLNVTLGTATDTVHQPGSFDCILSTHTFEHIMDLPEAARSIADLLADEGLAYIEVPDLTRYDAFPGRAPITYLFYEHINHFTPYTLKRLFAEAGLTMIDYGRKVLDEELEPSIPGCFAVLQKGNKLAVPDKVQTLEPGSPDEYLKLFAGDSTPANRTLQKLAESGAEVYIWGINFFLQRVMAMTPLKDCNIVALIDRDAIKQTKTIEGKPISPPSAIEGASPDSAVVVWRGPCGASISHDLKNAGYSGTIVVA